MTCVLLTLLLLQVLPTDSGVVAAEARHTDYTVRLQTLVNQIAESGRVLSLVPKLDEGIRIAPGAPPLLAFRYLEGRQRGRFGGLDLVLDDAGH